MRKSKLRTKNNIDMSNSKSEKNVMENSKEKKIDGKHKNHNLEILSQLVRQYNGREISIDKKYQFNEEKDGIKHETETDLKFKIFFKHSILYCETIAKSQSESTERKSHMFSSYHKIIPLRDDFIELSTTHHGKIESGKLMLDLIPHSIKNRLDDKHKKIVIQFETENRPVIRIVEGKE